MPINLISYPWQKSEIFDFIMKLVSILILCNSIIATKASFFNFRLPWLKNRVHQGNDAVENNFESPHNTPISTKSRIPIQGLANEKVFPFDFEPVNDDVSAGERGPVIKLKELLSPKITNGFDDLTENGANELLKLDTHIISRVLNDSNRFQFLLVTFDIYPNIKNNRRIALANISSFSEEIGRKLMQTNQLKDFVKILIEFYKFCINRQDLNKVLSAVLKSEIFTLEELLEALKMNYDEIFNFACVNNLQRIAKALIINRKVSFNITDGILEAFSMGFEDLVNELVNLTGVLFGTESSSVYHDILAEIAKIQLKK